MASILSASSPMATLCYNSGVRLTATRQIKSLSTVVRQTNKLSLLRQFCRSSMFGELRPVNNVRLKKAQPETLQIVQSILADQLCIDECTLTPQTKFEDLGADYLETVEITVALEEKFDIFIEDGEAKSISTVQDVADLIENVKAASS